MFSLLLLWRHNLCLKVLKNLLLYIFKIVNFWVKISYILFLKVCNKVYDEQATDDTDVQTCMNCFLNSKELPQIAISINSTLKDINSCANKYLIPDLSAGKNYSKFIGIELLKLTYFKVFRAICSVIDHIFCGWVICKLHLKIKSTLYTVYFAYVVKFKFIWPYLRSSYTFRSYKML